MPKRVTTVFSGVLGSPYYNNLFFADEDDAEACVTAVASFWGLLDNLMVDDLVYTVQGEVVTIDLTTGQPEAIENVDGANGVGALSIEALPAATQGLIRWGTGLFANGRQVRGRTFIPGLSEGSNANGVWASGDRTSVNNAATALRTDINTTFGIYSRTHQAFSPVTTSDLWEQFAVLRSRRD